MPNPKVGTVTPDVRRRSRMRAPDKCSTARQGRHRAMLDRARLVYPEQLRDNLVALVDAVNKSKPSNVKGIYLRKVSVSSTMGPGVRVDVASLGAGGGAQH